MRRAKAGWAACAVAALALAGCLAGDDPDGPSVGDGAVPWGVHPFPAGDGTEWPIVDGAPLAGPFERASLENLDIPSFDGTVMDTWLLRPDVPEGTRVPIVVWSSPYFGLNNQAGNDPSGWDNSGIPEATHVNLLVENGYAVAIHSLRGTGNSGGCFTWMGSDDWRDVAAAVEWLGSQEWSNGRVGMMGLSYHGTTPWQAAGQNPEHLKTIVTAGQVSNLYTFYHTPQGAPLTIGPAFANAVTALLTAPPLLASPEDIATGFPPVAVERICPELLPVLYEFHKTDYTPIRDAAFWTDRDMSSTWKDITASVFFTHGLLDYHGSGHAMEEDIAWQGLPDGVPKRAILGQYGHMFPNFADSYTETGEPEWDQVALEWLDFWLKGIGDAPPGEGTVRYQDSEWNWHNTTAWPPAEAHGEVLYLVDGGLAAEPGGGGESFLSRFAVGPGAAFCPDPLEPLGRAALAYVSEPLEENATIAGNPFVLLNLTSDLPGGQVAVTVLDVDEPSCPGVDGAVGYAAGIRFLGMGAADLQFHHGGFDAQDFPAGSMQSVRIDINNVAEVVPAGHRIGVVVHFGDDVYGSPNPYAPTITVDASSQVVLPVTTGTLGGDAPSAGFDYPPRPFAPWLQESTS